MNGKIIFFVLVLLVASVTVPTVSSIGIPSLTSEDLDGISMVSENSGWIVGTKGTILHYGGGTWSIVESPTTNNLADVDMVDGLNGWAVGYQTILRYDGMMNRWVDETFRVEGAPGQGEYWNFMAMSMISSDDGWVVGGSGKSGLLLHWDGTKWRMSQPPGNMGLSDISMIDSSKGWAVGGGTYTVMRWNGAYWTGQVVGPPNWEIQRVFALSETDVWATNPNAAPEGLYHWDGTTWTTTGLGSYDAAWRHAALRLFFLNENYGWASGYFFAGSSSLPADINNRPGTLLNWDGTTWKQVGDYLPVAILGLYFVNENNGWAVGEGGTIMKWDGNSWSVYASAVWPQPIWSQTWFWAIIVTVIVIGSGTAFVLLRRRKRLQRKVS